MVPSNVGKRWNCIEIKVNSSATGILITMGDRSLRVDRLENSTFKKGNRCDCDLPNKEYTGARSTTVTTQRVPDADSEVVSMWPLNLANPSLKKRLSSHGPWI